MKPKLTKPETTVAILTRLIGASLAGSTPTQAAEVRWGGWTVIAQRQTDGKTFVWSRNPREEASSIEARGAAACARKIADGGA